MSGTGKVPHLRCVWQWSQVSGARCFQTILFIMLALHSGLTWNYLEGGDPLEAEQINNKHLTTYSFNNNYPVNLLHNCMIGDFSSAMADAMIRWGTEPVNVWSLLHAHTRKYTGTHICFAATLNPQDRLTIILHIFCKQNKII